MQEKRKAANILIYSILTILSVIFIIPIALVIRSEERRVGKECRL